MKYFYSNSGSWIVDKRNTWYVEELKEIKDYKPKRSTDKHVLQSTKQRCIADSFVVLEIFFKTINLSDINIKNHFRDQKQNIHEIQKKSNKDEISYYVIVFDDDSCLVYEGNLIYLFDNEDKINGVMLYIQKKLKEQNIDKNIKKVCFKPDIL